MAIVGLMWLQNESLRSEIRDLRIEIRTEMRTEIGDLRGEVGDLRTEVGDLHGEVGDLRTEVGDLRGEVGDLRGEVGDLRGEVGDLRGEVGDLSETVAELQVTVARIEARNSLHPMLAERFAASGEGATYGGPAIAADILIARAIPEIDSVLGTIDQDAQSELANTLWEDRANILARAVPIL